MCKGPADPFSLDGFLRQRQPGLNVRLKTDIGEKQVNPVTSVKECQRLVGIAGGKRGVTTILQQSFRQHPDLILILHDQYLGHVMPADLALCHLRKTT